MLIEALQRSTSDHPELVAQFNTAHAEVKDRLLKRRDNDQQATQRMQHLLKHAWHRRPTARKKLYSRAIEPLAVRAILFREREAISVQISHASGRFAGDRTCSNRSCILALRLPIASKRIPS